MYLFEFAGMSGVEGPLIGPVVRSTKEAALGLLKFRIVGTAGKYGAVNLYKDDIGNIRGERCFYKRVVASGTFKTTEEALVWFEEQSRFCHENENAV